MLKHKNFLTKIMLILLVFSLFTLTGCDMLADLGINIGDINLNGDDPIKSDGENCEHSFGEWEIAMAATCANEGIMIRSCSKCGETEHEHIEKLEHKLEWVEGNEPSCVVEGKVSHYHCVNCNKNFTSDMFEIPNVSLGYLGHTFNGEYSHDEYTHYFECQCGLKDQISEHEFDEGLVLQAPTLVSEGLAEYKCLVCGYIKAVSIPRLDHEHVIEHIFASEATCTKDGNIEYYHCSSCDRYYTDASLTKEVTLYTVTIKALGHHVGEYEEANDATCVNDGNLGYYYCDTCKQYLDKNYKPIENVVIEAEGHNYSVEYCYDSEAHWYECSKCHDKLAYKEHNFDITVLSEPTEYDEGKNHYKCLDCGFETDVTIPALGHVHNLEHFARISNTCTEDGVIEYYHCTKCGLYYKDEACTKEVSEDDLVVKAPGHQLVYIDKKDSTCIACGNISHYICDECGKLFDLDKQEIMDISIDINPNNHKLIHCDYIQTTCSSTGEIEHYTCTLCKKVYNVKMEEVDSIVIGKDSSVHNNESSYFISQKEDGLYILRGTHCLDCGYSSEVDSSFSIKLDNTVSDEIEVSLAESIDGKLTLKLNVKVAGEYEFYNHYYKEKDIDLNIYQNKSEWYFNCGGLNGIQFRYNNLKVGTYYLTISFEDGKDSGNESLRIGKRLGYEIIDLSTLGFEKGINLYIDHCGEYAGAGISFSDCEFEYDNEHDCNKCTKCGFMYREKYDYYTDENCNRTLIHTFEIINPETLEVTEFKYKSYEYIKSHSELTTTYDEDIHFNEIGEDGLVYDCYKLLYTNKCDKCGYEEKILNERKTCNGFNTYSHYCRYDYSKEKNDFIIKDESITNYITYNVNDKYYTVISNEFNSNYVSEEECNWWKNEYLYDENNLCLRHRTETNSFGNKYEYDEEVHWDFQYYTYELSEGSITCDDGIDQVWRCAICGMELSRNKHVYIGHSYENKVKLEDDKITATRICTCCGECYDYNFEIKLNIKDCDYYLNNDGNIEFIPKESGVYIFYNSDQIGNIGIGYDFSYTSTTLGNSWKSYTYLNKGEKHIIYVNVYDNSSCILNFEKLPNENTNIINLDDVAYGEQDVKKCGSIICIFEYEGSSRLETYGNCSWNYDENGLYCTKCGLMHNEYSEYKDNGDCTATLNYIFKFSNKFNSNEPIIYEVATNNKISNHSTHSTWSYPDRYNTEIDGKTYEVETQVHEEICDKCGKLVRKQIYYYYHDLNTSNNMISIYDEYELNENTGELYKSRTQAIYRELFATVNGNRLCEVKNNASRYDVNGNEIWHNIWNREYIYDSICKYHYVADGTDYGHVDEDRFDHLMEERKYYIEPGTTCEDGVYYDAYCPECGETIVTHALYTHGHMNYVTSYELHEGSTNCEDGVDLVERCEICGKETNRITNYRNYHENVESIEYVDGKFIVGQKCSVCGKLSDNNYIVTPIYTYDSVNTMLVKSANSYFADVQIIVLKTGYYKIYTCESTVRKSGCMYENYSEMTHDVYYNNDSNEFFVICYLEAGVDYQAKIYFNEGQGYYNIVCEEYTPIEKVCLMEFGIADPEGYMYALDINGVPQIILKSGFEFNYDVNLGRYVNEQTGLSYELNEYDTGKDENCRVIAEKQIKFIMDNGNVDDYKEWKYKYPYLTNKYSHDYTISDSGSDWTTETAVNGVTYNTIKTEHIEQCDCGYIGSHYIVSFYYDEDQNKQKGYCWRWYHNDENGNEYLSSEEYYFNIYFTVDNNTYSVTSLSCYYNYNENGEVTYSRSEEHIFDEDSYCKYTYISSDSEGSYQEYENIAHVSLKEEYVLIGDSCNDGWYIKYTCDVCGDEHQSEIVYGHDFSNVAYCIDGNGISMYNKCVHCGLESAEKAAKNLYISEKEFLQYIDSRMIDGFVGLGYSVDQSGTYKINSCDLTDGDPYIQVYDENMNQLKTADDSNGTLNFNLEIHLEAGKKYYFVIRYLNNEILSDYHFNVNFDRLSLDSEN